MPTHTTDSDLFPLYGAVLTTCPDYKGAGHCAIHSGPHDHVFTLKSVDLVVRCKCGISHALKVEDRDGMKCPACGDAVKSPDLPAGDDLRVCADCVRAGKVSITHGTEFGLVTFAEAAAGLTGGVPGLNALSLGNNTFELGPVSEDEEEWRAVRVPTAELLELTRTPEFSSWQDPTWLFHCNAVMQYQGDWKKDDFVKEAKTAADGKKLFAELTGVGQAWKSVGTSASCHVHRCKACGTLRASLDYD